MKTLQVARLTWHREKFTLSGLSGLVGCLWPAGVLYRPWALPEGSGFFEGGYSTFVQAFVTKISGLTFLDTYTLTKKSPGLVPTVHPTAMGNRILGW